MRRIWIDVGMPRDRDRSLIGFAQTDRIPIHTRYPKHLPIATVYSTHQTNRCILSANAEAVFPRVAATVQFDLREETHGRHKILERPALY